MHKEYGGYLELELPKSQQEYHNNCIRLNNARNAIIYILKAKEYKKIYLPYYMCPSVIKRISEYEIDIEYYLLDQDFLPILNENFKDNETILYANYFGIFDKQVKITAQIFPNAIIDNTQSFYSTPLKNIDTIYAPRKFFGVSDGAYLFTNKYLKEKFIYDSSLNRCEHLIGRIESNANDYYEYFSKIEESFEQEDIKLMSPFTQRILSAVNYKEIAKIRIKNFKYLHKKLSKLNGLSDNIDNKFIAPFCYPLLIKDNSLRKKLIDNKIYISQLWKNVISLTPDNSLEANLSKYLLPLPIDQRYNKRDMEHIVEIINREIIS